MSQERDFPYIPILGMGLRPLTLLNFFRCGSRGRRLMRPPFRGIFLLHLDLVSGQASLFVRAFRFLFKRLVFRKHTRPFLRTALGFAFSRSRCLGDLIFVVFCRLPATNVREGSVFLGTQNNNLLTIVTITIPFFATK